MTTPTAQAPLGVTPGVTPGPRECNWKGCSTEIPAGQLCVYCPECLPKFIKVWNYLNKQDRERLLKLEKDSIEMRRKWLKQIEDPRYRDTLARTFKYYDKPKYKGLFN